MGLFGMCFMRACVFISSFLFLFFLPSFSVFFLSLFSAFFLFLSFFCFRLRGDDLTHVVNLIVLLSGTGASVAFLSGIRVFLSVGMVVCR